MKVLWSEGYRPFFPLFPVSGLLFLGIWVHAIFTGVAIPPAEHGAAMIWLVLGAGVLGFLLTAFPKQNQAPSPPAKVLAAFFAGQVATQGLLAASWFGAPTGVAATVTGALVWTALLVFVLRIAVPSLQRKWDGTTFGVPVAISAALAGWLAVRLLADTRLGLALGLHPFLLLLALSLLDRLLPFFSSKIPGYDGLRRPHFVPLLAVGALARALLHAHPLVPDLFLFALIARQWHGWRPLQGAREPMIGVLHLGVLWIVLGYLVDASGLATARSIPVHLWTLGGLGTLMFGISMRVTLGHGGLPIRMGAVGAVIVALGQAAVVTRAVLPLFGVPTPEVVYGGSAALLGVALVVWFGKFAPLTLRR